MKNTLIAKIVVLAVVVTGATYIAVQSRHSVTPVSSQVATLTTTPSSTGISTTIGKVSSTTTTQASGAETTTTTNVATVPVTTVPNDTGANAGANGANQGRTKVCDDTVGTVVMNPSYVAGSSPVGMSLNSGTYANANVTLATFRLENPTPCPMKVTMMSFVTDPAKDPSPIFTPLQNLKLMVAGTEFGTLVHFTSGWDETTGTWVTPADTIGSVAFTSATGVIVPAFGSTDFNFVADGRNVPPPNSVQIQLTGFDSSNTLFTSMTNNESYPGSMGLIESPVIPWSL